MQFQKIFILPHGRFFVLHPLYLRHSRRGVNRKTDRQILTIFLPGFRIQSTFFNGFADPAIEADCGFIQFFGPGFWILLAIKFGLWISTILRNALLCFTFCFLVTRKTYCMSRSTEIVTHQSQGVTCCRRDAQCYLSPHNHITNTYPLQYYPVLAVFGKLYDLTRFGRQVRISNRFLM